MALLLSLKRMTLLSRLVACVAAIMSISEPSSGRPSTVSRPLKNQWRLCSLLLCAKSKHSTLVGLPASSKQTTCTIPLRLRNESFSDGNVLKTGCVRNGKLWPWQHKSYASVTKSN